MERCDGCTACAMRCTAGITLSEYEYTRILEELRSQDHLRVRKVLEQDKQLRWFEETCYTACLFLDVTTRLCLIYPARPLVCRLFGRVKHLPCPTGAVPADIDADRILEGYTHEPRLTFQEWMAAFGIFNFDDLLGGQVEVPSYEL